MCGITSAILKKDTDKFWKLVLASEIRGQDGTGVARFSIDNNNFRVDKWNKKASLIEPVITKKGDWLISQNRLAVFGLDSRNNQPIVTNRYALVHNGNLFQFEEKFKELGLKREYEVDSELILRFIEDRHPQNTAEIFQCIRELFDEIKGNMACLLLDIELNYLVAFSYYKPLWTYEDEEGIYFFSTESIGEKVFKDKQFKEIEHNHCMIIERDINILTKKII